MNHPPFEITFSAGMENPDPAKHRVVGQDLNHRFQPISAAFPEVGAVLAGWPMLVQAYPAGLGLRGAHVTLADTYLRDVTTTSAIELAARENRDVVFVAQPLAGAELLLRAIDGHCPFPKNVLWGVGGYYMPASLERFMVTQCRKHGCELSFLYSYGVAEVGHTCFAATQRDHDGRPKYRKIADEVEATVSDVKSTDFGLLWLRQPTSGVSVNTGDLARFNGDEWTILGNPRRLDDAVRGDLESWTDMKWLRRTGYLYATRERVFYQLRKNYRGPVQSGEVPFYRFSERFGDELHSKPKWGIQSGQR